MKLHVVVTVDVIKCEPRRAKRLELGPDLAPQLLSDTRAQKEPDRCADGAAQFALSIDEIGKVVRWQHRRPLTHGHVKTDAQARISARSLNRVRGRWRADEQARGGQHTALMGFLDSFIHRHCQSEVVACDNYTLAHAISSAVWRE
jgi:hypothetical protein